MHRLLLVATPVLAFLAGCADEGASRFEDPPPGGSGECAGVTPVAGTDIQLRLVVDGLDQPVFLTAPPGDTRRLYVIELPGVIRLLVDGALRAEPFLDLRDRVKCCGEQGLLSLAFHPDYAANGRLFVNYTEVATGDVLLSELTAGSPEQGSAATERVLLRIPHRELPNHNGGRLAFDRDGYLFMSVGDGGGAGDPLGAAQDRSRLLGKMLRLDVDGPTPAGSGLVPPGNPFGNEVWGYGLRNPWRFSFDSVTGDMYIGDVGQNEYEEVNVEPAGSAGGINWGWPLMEGDGHCFDDPDCALRDIRRPIYEYSHAGRACSIIGGSVYRGCALPDLAGTYFFIDYCEGMLMGFPVVSGGAGPVTDYGAAVGRVVQPTSFGEDGRGEIYVLSRNGAVLQIAAR